MGGVSYQSDADMAPDSAFESGSLSHLVVGNKGRLLDPRRTPVRVVGLRPELAFFEVEVLAFEDRGAKWELPMDAIDRFQFAIGGERVPPRDVQRLAETVRRFDAVLDIAVDPSRRQDTLDRLAAERDAATDWFEGRSTWARGDRAIDLGATVGDHRLFNDLVSFMADRGLGVIEDDFARSYVSNPSAGEVVRGHAIVAAELGLAAYRGPAVRDPASFTGDWSRRRRADHLLARLAFTSTLLALAGHPAVDLYRGMSFDGGTEWRRAGPFVSATFSRSIAEAQATLGPHRSMAVLLSQRLPVDRVLMTYHETPAMNAQFQEAEAVVLSAPSAVF